MLAPRTTPSRSRDARHPHRPGLPLAILAVTAALGAACGGSAAPPVDDSVQLDRGSATLSVGKQLQLTATSKSAITWSIDGAQGGGVTSAGLYLAPAAPGLFHVRATATLDPTRSAVDSYGNVVLLRQP